MFDVCRIRFKWENIRDRVACFPRTPDKPWLISISSLNLYDLRRVWIGIKLFVKSPRLASNSRDGGFYQG